MDSHEIDPKNTNFEVNHIESAKDITHGVASAPKHYQPETDEEKALDRSINLKLDFFVVSVLSLGFILCGSKLNPVLSLMFAVMFADYGPHPVDKTNIGFVATSTFIQDANLPANAVGNALSLFSATYVPLQPFSTLAARRFNPKYWIALLLATWGILCMAHAAIKNNATLIALRLLLGAAESGFTPSSYYLMSSVYPKYTVGLRMGVFSGMFAVAGAFAGLIAYGLLQIHSEHIKGWQIVFLFEGGLTVVTAVLVLVLLPRNLETAWFLTPLERIHAVKRMSTDYAASQEFDSEGRPIPDNHHVSWRDITDVLKDWKKLLIILFNVLGVLPVNAFTTFMPLIVQGMGYSGTRATLMSVPPFVVGAVVLVIIVLSSDRSRERSGHIIFGMTLALIGCIVMATSQNPRLRYGFSNICMAGIFVSGPLAAVWLAGNTPLKVRFDM